MAFGGISPFAPNAPCINKPAPSPFAVPGQQPTVIKFGQNNPVVRTKSSGCLGANNIGNNNNLAPFGGGSASSSSAPSPFAVGGAGSNGSNGSSMPASPFAQRTPMGQLPSPFAPRNNDNGGFGSTQNAPGQFGGFGSNHAAPGVPNKIVFGGGSAGSQNQQNTHNPSPFASMSSSVNSMGGFGGGNGSGNMDMMEDAAPVLSSGNMSNMNGTHMNQGLSSSMGGDGPMSMDQGMSVEMGGATTSTIVFGQGGFGNSSNNNNNTSTFGQGAVVGGGQKIQFGQGASQSAGSGIKFGGGSLGGGLSFGSNISFGNSRKLEDPEPVVDETKNIENELPAHIRAAFEASAFEPGKIPEIPPPEVFCH